MGLHVHQRKHCEFELKDAAHTPATYRWFSEISSGQRKITDELKSSNPLLSTDPPSKTEEDAPGADVQRSCCFCCKRLQGSTLSAMRFRHIFLWGPPLNSHLFWDMLASWACFLGQNGSLPWPDLWDVWSWAAREKRVCHVVFPKSTRRATLRVRP